VWEQVRNDPTGLPFQRPHALDLGSDESLEVGRQVDYSPGSARFVGKRRRGGEEEAVGQDKYEGRLVPKCARLLRGRRPSTTSDAIPHSRREVRLRACGQTWKKDARRFIGRAATRRLGGPRAARRSDHPVATSGPDAVLVCGSGSCLEVSRRRTHMGPAVER